ncbi:prepilin peptidase [Streptomyces meridianus]|uniref:Prepilin peptidase n=1 Tax=Streptomyces meridianus TaxID=2938945 RepID=A0ABT0X1C5_9ACTN|nr:prepilin peptidase [Streptomyces meridianus]MCM2576284.1 prepilin peptidase [Streptomyces meridianus]
MMLSLFAAGYGVVAGLLVSRPAYRLAVPADEPWRTACPAGHPLTGPARGWLGPARCAPCGGRAPATSAASGESGPAASAAAASGEAAVSVPVTDPAADRAGQTTDGPATASEPRAPASTAPEDLPGAEDPDQRSGPEGPTGPATAHAGAHRPRGRYGPRTVAVSLVTGAGCAVIAAAVGPRPELAVWLLLTPVAVLLALVDRAVHRLPDVLTLPLAGAAAVLLGLADLLPGNAGSWPGALLGGAALGAVYVLLFVINPNGMGFGDVKLALAVGLALGWYGWPVLIAGAFAGFVAGAGYGLGLMLLRRAGRKTAMPFGPFMIFGAFLGVLLGGPGPL